MKHWIAIALLALPPATHAAPKDDATRAEVQSTFEHCIRAMRTLDADKFDLCFDDDATLFNPDIPEANTLHLVQGRTAISAYFRGMFDNVRQHAPEPKLDIQPRDVAIQLAGDAAVVTFEFARPDKGYGRRTMVLVHRRGGWKILHIHASNVPGSRADN